MRTIRRTPKIRRRRATNPCLVVGLAENLAGAYVSSAYKDVVAFAVLILVLAVRPAGILGGRGEEKV
jgi:branched-chain amino acid transport system permease protein